MYEVEPKPARIYEKKTLNIVDTRERNPRSVMVKIEEEFKKKKSGKIDLKKKLKNALIFFSHIV